MAEKKITKAEIVDMVYEKTGINRKDIKIVSDLLFEAIKDALTEGMVIEFRGFGTFEIRIRKGRQKARNPKTGKEVAVLSHGIAAFRAGRELKQAVWNLPSRIVSSEPEMVSGPGYPFPAETVPGSFPSDNSGT